jgi:PAS domain S-box-containing protein
MFASLNLGIALVIAGLVFVILVWGVLSLLPRAQATERKEHPLAPEAPEKEAGSDAIVVIQQGGRVDYVNAQARDWFGLRDNDPADLERLVRRVRPPDDFLEVCAAPGNKRLNVNGKAVEVTSYRVPGVQPQMLISLRGMEMAPALAADGSEFSSSMLRIITEYSEAIASSLEFEPVVHSILDYVLRLIPADLIELKAWDAETRAFTTYRFEESNGSGRKLRRLAQSQFGALTQDLLDSQKAILRSDVSYQSGGAGNLPLTSYLGVRLLASGELVGLLEAGKTTGAAFTKQDFELLELIAGQTGAALRNAMLHEQERQRTKELSGLANLAQAVVAIHEPEDLFARLVESVAPLFDVHVVGFLIYDEEKGTLEGQVPFRGLPANIVQIYRAPVPKDSPAEALLRERRMIQSMNAAGDANWRVLGLTDIALAASLRDSMLMPLIASGKMSGYLQLSHHVQGTKEFSESELRLLHIVADQAAAIIENAVLVRQSRERAERSEALQRISGFSAASTTLDEMLGYALGELKRLFRADAAAIFLLDQARGVLSLHRASLVSSVQEAVEAFPDLVVDEPEYQLTAGASRRILLNGHLSVEHELPAFYRPFDTTLHLESAVIVPVAVRGKTLGELALGSHAAEYFNESDAQIISVAGGQLGSAIEGLRLASETDSSLRRRVEQLTSIARVSRELAASLSVNHLLTVIHDETILATGADCGSILLLEPGAGEVKPRQLQSMGCPYGEELSYLERSAIQNNQAFLVTDFSKEEFASPHPGILSAMLVPIAHSGQVLGLIQLHGTQPGCFDTNALETAQTLAAQASIALRNARQYHSEQQQSELLRRRADTLAKFSAAASVVNAVQPLEDALKSIALGISESTPFQVVLVSLYEPDSGLLRRVTGVGIPPETLAELVARKQPLASLRQLMKPEFRISRSYYIPADATPVLPTDIHYVYAGHYSETQTKQNAWNPDDFLLIPLEDTQGKPLGLISLDDPSNGLRPDRVAVESAELFAAEAAQSIINAMRFSEMSRQIESLSSGMQRQQRLLSVSQNDLPLLLHKDLEQTISLQDLDRRAQRVRAGLAITESVSRQLDASSALLALGRETLTQLGMAIALVAENTPDGPRLIHVLGNIPRSANPEALFGQRNPLRTMLQNGEPILVSNLDENDEWRESPLLGQLRAKGVVCLPVMMENRPIAGMLALSAEPLPVITDEDQQVYFQISRQASVVLQNISLLNETRRRLQEVNLLLEFSRRLGGMDPSQIVRALLESGRRVIQAAHAGVVLLWNEQGEILEPQAASGYADNDGMMRIAYRRGEALPGSVFASGKARRVDEINFPRDYVLTTENLGIYRAATGGRLPVSSLLLPIMTGEKGIGLIVLDNFNTPGAFRPEDEALMLSLSQQVALSLENVRLVHAMTERAGQLEALNEISTAMTSSLRSEELVERLLDQLQTILPFDTATLFLRDSERLTVAAARGFPDTERRLGLTIAVTDSALFKEMVKSSQPISVGDVRQDARFPLVEAPRLSWLGIPLISKGQLIGLIALEKWQAYFYSHEQIQLATTFAGQAAVALDNANLYEDSLGRAAELDERSKRLALLNRFSSSLSGLLEGGQILELTANELRHALNASRVSAVVFDHGQATWRSVSPATVSGLPKVLPDAPLFARLRESLGIFNTEAAKSEAELLPLRGFISEEVNSLLVLPLISGQELRALMFAQDERERHFSLTEIELARTIANQASIALENARLYESTVRTAERFALLNQASAEVGGSLEPEQIYASIYHAAGRLVPLDAFVISLLDESTQEVEGVYLMDMNQRLPNMRVPLGQGLSSTVILRGEPYLINGRELAQEMGGISVGEYGTAVSTLAVPIVLGGKTTGMLSAQSYQPNVYTGEDLQILSTLANQAGVSIQNGRLFGETQRLAREFEQRVIERTAELRREQQNTETLLRILTEVSASLDLDRALNRTLSLLNEAVGAEQGTIMLLSAEDNQLHYRAGYGYLSERSNSDERGLTLKVGEGLAGWVVKNREAALVDDLYRDRRWVRSSSTSREHRSAVVAPLLVAEDVIGVLMVFSRTQNFFSADSLNLVKAIAGQVAVAINNAHLYELIRDQAERLGAMLRKEQEEASRSQAILEAVADGVLVTGADNRITFVNSSVERILGIESRQVVGHTLEESADLFGKAGSTWMETIRRWSRLPNAYEYGDSYAEQLELGEDRIALVHLAPVVLQNDFLGTVSIFRDITHEVEVDRLKSEFVATVSHELRTPMTAIKGYVEILLMGAAGAINESQSHFLDIVKNNIDRLNILVSDLLDISRIEAGRVTLALQALDLSEIANEAIADLQRQSAEEKKPMKFSLEAPKTLPRVLGDPERVRQILSNLLDNSYHYTPEQGTIMVHLRTLGSRGEVEIDVIDDGVGIAKAEQDRVFERFYRGEHPFVLATPGTGLGLAIVRQLVEMHKGRIWMKSEGVAGEGSTFSFTLPIYKEK